MRVATKPVYYCDHCGRHRLTRSAIENHEPHCIKNPERVCGWCSENTTLDVTGMAERIKGDDAPSIVELRAALHGCPCCMLSALVRSGRRSDYYEWLFEDEVKAFRTTRDVHRPW